MLPKKLGLLVNEAALHEDALRADLQETYGIDLDHAMAGAHTPAHIAALVAQLPPDARLRVEGDKDAVWTLRDIILVQLLNDFRTFMWGMSDSRRRGAAPQPIGPAWLTGRRRRTLPARVLPIDELMAELGKPRR